MSRRLKAVIIIEILILFGLAAHIFKSPGMIIVVGLAILFSFLAKYLQNKVFKIISAIFWGIAGILMLTLGWFWLALIFPAIACIVFWKNNPRDECQNQNFSFFKERREASENIVKANGDDIIDLDNIRFGDSLTIKKGTGNTKILVPDNVAVMLDISINVGIVKIFDEAPQINAGNIHYFSDNAEHADRRIKLVIRVDNGNVEVVRG